MGGQVHVLLGNHEVMVLNNDLRYLHRKYVFTSALFTTRYDQFFRQGSILGDWLSAQPVMVSINKVMYVHGGISNAVLGLDMTIDQINKTYIDQLIRKGDEEGLDEILSTLYYEEGPLWYRGYFDTAEVSQQTIDKILHTLGQDAIVVGHTSMSDITSLYEGKVIAVDCSIKIGNKGQILLIKDDKWYAGDLNGEKRRLRGPYDQNMISLFEYLYNLNDGTEVHIEIDVKELVKHKEDEAYQPADMMIVEPGGIKRTLKGRVRSRGNMRKKVCRLPPVKFDFSKSYLDSLGFVEHDKLKLVFPCNGSKDSQKKLLREHFLYGLYQSIDSTTALRSKLLDMYLEFEGDEKEHFIGILVEDEEEYMFRNNAKVITSGVINDAALDRSSFLRLLFFQYMIKNTDWYVATKHNLELVKLPDMSRVVAVPYDFDYAGFVDQPYAVPHESLPIKDVKERYFMKYKIREAEYYALVKYYLGLEEKIYTYCDQSINYLGDDEVKYAKSFFKSFFDLLRYPDRLKSEIVR